MCNTSYVDVEGGYKEHPSIARTNPVVVALCVELFIVSDSYSVIRAP